MLDAVVSLDQFSTFSTWFVVASLILYTLACELNPRFLTRLNSNGFTSKFRSNFGPKFFKWQKIFFVTYHQHDICWYTHCITFELDFLAQFIFFKYLNLHVLLSVFLALQTQTFKSAKLQVAALIHLALVEFLVSHETAAAYYVWCFPVLLIGGMLRSASHAAERLPPVMNGVDQFSEEIGLFKMRDLTTWYILQRYYIGTISEINAGLIHRLHYCVIDFILDGGVKAEDQKAALQILDNGFSESSLESDYRAIEKAENDETAASAEILKNKTPIVKKEEAKQEEAQADASDA